ncbi:nucleotidyltransferase family protein [Streptomyces sp. ISL-90]|nr:nucleotidyltransferase family protein [Streptomyces sp. ISL-90]
MKEVAETSDRLRADAHAADELHERSRTLLVGAVRAGAAAGLSQRQIAAAIGRSQPEVSRLLRFHGGSELGRKLTRNRKAILEFAARRGIRNVRVFGSVARGSDRPDSDIDLLVDLAPGTGLFALARLENDLSELLHAKVDVVPARTLREHVAERVLGEAVPL